jgi:hypothetical protein
MANVDNYFLILGLGEYKPATNFVDATIIGTSDDDSAVMQIIKTAIDTKRPEWAKGTSMDPRKATQYKHYIELIPKMETALADLETRKIMYADAKEQVAQMLKRPLGNLYGKGYVFDEEIERVAKQCNLSVEIVTGYVPVSIPIRKKEKVDGTLETIKKLTSRRKYKDIALLLQNNGYSDIYVFLCEGMGSSFTRTSVTDASDWLYQTKEKLSKLPDHKKQDIADKKRICEFCIAEVFVSEEKKKEYEEFLHAITIWEILQEVKQACSVTNELTTPLDTEIIDRIYSAGIDKDKAILCLQQFCKDERIAYGTPKPSLLVRCPYCSSMAEADARICPHCGGEIIVACPKCG